VRSPLITTIMQVSSRLLLVHAIVAPYPESTTTSPFYTSMLLAWSITEVIRYGYFVQTLRGASPGPLTWLRYNTFFVLYPVGIMSEVVCIWNASLQMQKEGFELGKWASWLVLGIYVPGSYVLYSHMMAQRRRMVRGKMPVRKARVNSIQ
jgi:very-long-chain (3R)-3-hydroxyacyl-CoA dehydratase